MYHNLSSDPTLQLKSMEEGSILLSYWEFFVMHSLQFLRLPREVLQPFQNSFMLSDVSNLRTNSTQRYLVLSDYRLDLTRVYTICMVRMVNFMLNLRYRVATGEQTERV